MRNFRGNIQRPIGTPADAAELAFCVNTTRAGIATALSGAIAAGRAAGDEAALAGAWHLVAADLQALGRRLDSLEQFARGGRP